MKPGLAQISHTAERGGVGNGAKCACMIAWELEITPTWSSVAASTCRLDRAWQYVAMGKILPAKTDIFWWITMARIIIAYRI